MLTTSPNREVRMNHDHSDFTVLRTNIIFRHHQYFRQFSRNFFLRSVAFFQLSTYILFDFINNWFEFFHERAKDVKYCFEIELQEAFQKLRKHQKSKI